ncbi:AAA domain-containing protein [Thermodesulfovibrio sp. 3462-1]|uniref:AAA domain-containing protein n=1 Tax=Thermodesulfovibrio obliviosus TaxID=3118332 RepID=A0AAU8H3C6_9BACT
MNNQELAVSLIDYYIAFLSHEKTKFIISDDPENLVFLSENYIAEIVKSIKQKGYRNFDLFQIIKDEEVVARIKELIEKTQSEIEKSFKLAFAFPVFKDKEKSAYCALSKYDLDLKKDGKLVICPEEINKKFIEKLKEIDPQNKKIQELEILTQREDHTKDFEFYLTFLEIFAGLSHIHLLPLPEPLSSCAVGFTLLNNFKKLKDRLILKNKDYETTYKDKTTSNEKLVDLNEEQLGFIYIYPDSYYTKNLCSDLKKIKNKIKSDRQMEKKICQLWDYKTKTFNRNNQYRYAFLENELTRSQQEAYNTIINNFLSLIEGPPGTGKTQLIVTFAADMMLANKKVVITSTNNKAVDNVYQKLKEFDEKNKSHFKTGKILRGYSRLGSESYIKEFAKELKEFIDEVKQIPDEKIEENINSLTNEVNILRDFIDKYYQIKQISYDEYKEYFKDSQLMEDFVREQLKTLKYLIERLNKWYLNLFPINLLIGKKYKEDLAKFCDEKGLCLPSLRDRKYLSCKEIYNREKDTLDLLDKLCELNLIKKEFKNLTEKVKILINENEEDIDKLFELARKFYYIRKKELNYWQLANDKDWISKIKDWISKIDSNKIKINKGQLWGLEDYIFKYAPVLITTALSSPVICKPAVDLIDYVIVDEAAQTLFCYTFSLFIRGKQFVAIGDNNQLGPVVTKKDYISLPQNIKPYLSCDKSVYDVIEAITNKTSFIRLKEHFRCARPIIEFCDKLIKYDLEIKTEAEKLEIKNSRISHLFKQHLAFIDVKGRSRGNKSKYNEEEIKVIVDLISELSNEIKLEQVGVIAPFRLQIEKLKERMKDFKELALGTIHTFQGEEKDIIILSCVCGNAKEFQNSRLLPDKRLMNVAVSRARKHLIVVGNKEAIEHIPDDGIRKSPIKELLNHISKEGIVVNGDIFK